MKQTNEKLFLAVEFSFSAIVLVISLLLSIRLTAESDRVSQLEEEYDRLCSENEILTAEYEGAMGIEEIERYAIEVLGMQRCDPSQIIYLELQP